MKPVFLAKFWKSWFTMVKIVEILTSFNRVIKKYIFTYISYMLSEINQVLTKQPQQ